MQEALIVKELSPSSYEEGVGLEFFLDREQNRNIFIF